MSHAPDRSSASASNPGTPSPGKGLRPLQESFPNSNKVTTGDLQVPQREILLTNGETLRVYDTTGPQGHAPKDGLPKRRQPWIDARLARGDQNFSQMHYARRGIVTEEMRFVAIRENCDPEFVRSRDRPRPRDHPGQHQAPGNRADDHRPQLPREDQQPTSATRRSAVRSTKRSRSCSGRSAGAPTR
jgi:hypothetical protein